MEQAKIVFVDTDEDYLLTLVMKFISNIKDYIDITMITDPMYLQKYLEQPHDINILIINEKLYTPAFERYSIDDVYYLTETTDENATEPYLSNYLYKYSSVSEIYQRVLSLSNFEAKYMNEISNTKLIMVYSPIGGSGRTFSAIGLARALSGLNKKVLYLNLETIQNFNYFMMDKSYAPRSFTFNLSAQGADLIDSLKASVKTESFDYLPPFEQSATALNITMSSYFNLLHQLVERKIYEYVVLDTSTEFNEEKARLMYESDQVLIITNQDRMSAWKLDTFLRNIDFSDKGKFLILCNSYHSGEENVYTANESAGKYTITDYIKRLPQRAECINTTNIAESTSFQKIAYYLL